MSVLDRRTQDIFAEHERTYLDPPEEHDEEYCDCCGDRIYGKFYRIDNYNYCLNCMEYYERWADD